MESTERVVISRSDSIGSRAAVSASVPRAVRMCVWTAPYSSMCVGRKWEFALCQNCVTYPPKPWGNTVTYGDTSTHIDVAEIVESEVRWWDLVCVSTRERIQFPSVLLQPLGHLSVFRINSLRASAH
jgi:hypothetical protein